MKLYNTPKKTTEDIQPQNPPVVTVYTCGPTVYDYPHIGNWFTFIRYDLLIRTLKGAGFKPKWVMNITDVGHLVSDADEGEDKLEKGARREGKSAWDVADQYTKNFLKGLEKLNFSKVDELPKATDHIAEQIELIKKLEAKGFTYATDDGVYFDTSKFPAYADFAGLNLEEQAAGARVEVNPQKKNPSDFTLWKLSPAGQQRDMEWDSPWGKGFPGWHLECSAMSMKYLGDTIDIHAGGIDHVPVHHTNEIAQSEAATGKPFVKYWLHANHILVDGKKIAKSLGNGITLEDIEAKGFSPLDVRMLALESHYRSQAQFSWSALEAAKTRLKELQDVADLRFQPRQKGEAGLVKADFEHARDNIKTAVEDDLNTPVALSAISQFAADMLHFGIEKEQLPHFGSLLRYLDESLGLDLLSRTNISKEQKELLAARAKARGNSDWKASDQLRAQLAAKSLGVRDTAFGQVWYRL